MHTTPPPSALSAQSRPPSFIRRLNRLFFFLLLVPMAGWAEEKVLYPRSIAPAEAPAPVRSPGSNVSLLAFAFVAAGTGGWLLWRQRRSPQGLMNREARKLAIAETRSLGNRQYLVVADYDGRKFLLGVCPGRIDLLSPLDDNAPPRTP